MNLSNLVTAESMAIQSGVKMITFGPPGSGKTPVMNTAPRPVCLVAEPGMLTMRGSKIPCYDGSTIQRIGEFFDWIDTAEFHQHFDTACVDSGSEVAEISLRYWMNLKKDGRAAYGAMSEQVVPWFEKLFRLQNKHVYIICKQITKDEISTSFAGGVPIITTIEKSMPYFPGKDAPMKIAHKYDLIAQAGKFDVPGAGRVPAFRCKETPSNAGRDRSGKLNEFEPMDLTALFKKAMS